MKTPNAWGTALLITLIAVPLSVRANAAGYKAGAARVRITPERPVLLTAYPTLRVHRPAEAAIDDLSAKALAIEDAAGKRVVILSLDINLIPRSVADALASRLERKFGLRRSEILVNVTHTHSGPLLDSEAGFNPVVIYDASAEELANIRDYTATLLDKCEAVVGAALGNLAPARLAIGNGRAGFAVNRRLKAADGTIQMRPNPGGPTDHDVPVLQVTGEDGKLKAVLFGYACHPVTLWTTDSAKATPAYMLQFSADYPGAAERELEKKNPGAVALFVQLCGADQNPVERGEPVLAVRYGMELAAEVARVLRQPLRAVSGPIRSTYRLVDLKFSPVSRQALEKDLSDKSPVTARHAKAMLKALDEGRLKPSYPYPAQAIAWGSDLALIAFGGEVVVDYALRLKKEYGAEGLIVAGYSNDVMAYIPTRRMLSEGGHEVDYSMVPFGHAARWDGSIEETVMETARGVLESVGRMPAGTRNQSGRKASR
jgi:neutral ceramidase